jgi:hypothetical protein
MAETPDSPIPPSPLPPRPKAGQEFWALVALGAVALVCFTLLAVGLALILSRSGGQAPISISNIGNGAAPAVAALPAPAPGGIQRPWEPAKPQSERAPAMDRSQPALPGLVASPTPPSGQRQLALTRADPPSPPSPALPTPQPTPAPTVDPFKVYFRVRADPTSLYEGQKALPMPVRYVPDAHGAVAAVYASRDVSASAERFSYSPDVAFAESGVSGRQLDVQVSQPRKTSSVDGYRAPKGFQFFTATLTFKDRGREPVALQVDDLEVHDVDGLRYLANPELVVGAWPQPSLAAGAEAKVEMSFLVPESSPLKELAVQEAPGQMALVPLLAR